jgi:uncharacterized protein (DUF885 family)
MPTDQLSSDQPAQRPVREVADGYVLALADLNPILATVLGLHPGEDLLPDLSPDGQQATDALARTALAELASVEATGPPGDADERRCARLMRERLEGGLARSEAGDHLRAVSNIFGPMQSVRSVFMSMPSATADDWAVIARRMARVPEALAGYRATLAEGQRRGLHAAPLQVRTVVGQLAEWAASGAGRGWFADFTSSADVPPALRADLDAAAAGAMTAFTGLGEWLAGAYQPQAEGTPDGVGAERYRRGARQWTGANLDPAEAYAWGWSQFLSLREEMSAEAERVLPGATALEAMRYLDRESETVHGVEEIRRRLQRLMDDAITDLQGTHFDLADPLKTVEARIAPPGSAAAPYYTPPSQDFSRPGRTWLPTLGQTSFPVWNLVSVWYHEGVPGHHLQLAQWRHLSSQLSMYQTSVGGVSACSEGWALYAERLMDELGYLSAPGARLGYLDAQMMRAVRVVIDIGMHLELEIPGDSPIAPGGTWTPDLGREFFAAHSGRDHAFIDSEIVRYLSAPGQAISYKLGERAWLAGRAAAQAARGASFDLKSWHMAALSLGSLGLDDLTDELAAL